ncbi:MAG: MoaD/ThiS family protein [Planctomycetaceae bacterium]|jgi:molybdopterin synthase sulfur carrier subunit
MVSVFIPPAWRDLTAGLAEVRLPATNVRQVIEGLEGLYPGIAARALAEDSLKPGLAVSINGTISRRGLRAALPEGTEVHFLPALGGG